CTRDRIRALPLGRLVRGHFEYW
nr:immunoglobulin heavy chain junction region [Macaca mulatta]MOW24247.1 immunoglobulin heavy chain junction region [Macaca mulatta]MOW25995.1 immunoglobulin heavy chain junction region [Macaca mulatta]MOW26787.1 immunoglobulin heavy chain junction region [Macaca mulatta]